MATVFVLTGGLWLFKGPKNMLMFQVITLPSTFLTFLFAQRRVAYGALAFGLIILIGYIPAKTRKRLFTHVLIPSIPLVMLYAWAFWNSNSGLATPIRQVKEIFETDEENRSNLYRDIEKINLSRHHSRVAPRGGLRQEVQDRRAPRRRGLPPVGVHPAQLHLVDVVQNGISGVLDVLDLLRSVDCPTDHRF
ncbi:MAG: hypothetical protein ACI9EF_001361 [Pseudohongiellaceae bacterium]|jgi:hypothetical protein